MPPTRDPLVPQPLDLSDGYEPEVGDVIAFRDVSGAIIRGPVTLVTPNAVTVSVTRDLLFQRSHVMPFEVFRESEQD